MVLRLTSGAARCTVGRRQEPRTAPHAPCGHVTVATHLQALPTRDRQHRDRYHDAEPAPGIARHNRRDTEWRLNVNHRPSRPLRQQGFGARRQLRHPLRRAPALLRCFHQWRWLSVANVARAIKSRRGRKPMSGAARPEIDHLARHHQLTTSRSPSRRATPWSGALCARCKSSACTRISSRTSTNCAGGSPRASRPATTSGSWRATTTALLERRPATQWPQRRRDSHRIRQETGAARVKLAAVPEEDARGWL